MSSPERTINFTRGVPADDAFPAAELADCVTAVLRERPVQVLQYGPSTGFLPLREWLAERHGVPVDHVLVGNGSLSFIDLLGWALLERGDTVLVESPTYDRTLTLLRRHGVRLVGVPISGGGLDLDARVVARIAKAAEDTYITPNLLGQAAVYEFCRRGLLEPQLERLRALYRPRLEAASAAMRRWLPDAQWTEPDGGFFLSLTLGGGLRSEDLRARAAAAKLNMSDGRGFFPDPADGERFVRLPFCALAPEEIGEGIRRMADVVADAGRRA